MHSNPKRSFLELEFLEGQSLRPRFEKKLDPFNSQQLIFANPVLVISMGKVDTKYPKFDFTNIPSLHCFLYLAENYCDRIPAEGSSR